jgi:hypothetical protein
VPCKQLNHYGSLGRRALPAMLELSHPSTGYPLPSENLLLWLGDVAKLTQEIKAAVFSEF